jgi:hypothetical protein
MLEAKGYALTYREYQVGTTRSSGAGQSGDDLVALLKR